MSAHVPPSHYARLNPQPIEVIEMIDADFNVGNVIKYAARAGFKDDLKAELVKVRYYLHRHRARCASSVANRLSGLTYVQLDNALSAVAGWNLRYDLTHVINTTILSNSQGCTKSSRVQYVTSAFYYLDMAEGRQ